jgi:hypothetical protein
MAENGEVMVDRLPWDSSEIAAKVADIAGPGAKLVPPSILIATGPVLSPVSGTI